MSQDNWTSNSSGSWNDNADWSEGAPPADTDNVVIGVAGVTVSVGTDVTNAVALTLTTYNSILDIDGGDLFTLQSAAYNGAFYESAGTYTMSGSGASFYNTMDLTGGIMDALSGAITLYDGGSLAGTLAGAGTLDVVSGTAYVQSGFSASIDSIEIGQNGGKIGFDTNFSYGGRFTLLPGGVMDTFGHTVKLSGPTLLEGTIGNGKLVETGTLTIGEPNSPTVIFDNGLLLSVADLVLQNSNVALGANDAGAKVSISKQGVWDINGNLFISNPASDASISNAGLFAKAAGAHVATIYASFSSSGTVAADIGTLLLDGPVNSLAGTISGAGTLAVGGVQTTLSGKIALDVATFAQQGGELVLDHTLAYGGSWDLLGGVLDLNAANVKLTLTGDANFDGGTLTSFGGTVNIDGAAQASNVLIGGPTTINVNGTFDQTATIGFGESSNPVINIASGASYVLEGDSSIIGVFGNINNSGTFIDPNGSGDAVVQANIVNNATITVDNSTLTLAGTNVLNGTLSGTGLLDLTGETLLDKGLVIDVGAIAVDNAPTYLAASQSFAGTFMETGNSATLDLGGYVFSLSGAASLDAGLLTDGGTLSVTGDTEIGNYSIGGGATLNIAGTAEQTGNLVLAPASGPGSVNVAGSGSYTIDDDWNIYGPGSINNAGTFTASGTGATQIGAAFDNTGTLNVNDQTLNFGAGASFAGTIDGAGTIVLGNFIANNAYVFDAGLAISAAGLQISSNVTATLAGNQSFAGDFDVNNGTLQMEGYTLKVSGSTDITSGTMFGTGTLIESGSTTLGNFSVLTGGILSIAGSATQIGNIAVGDSPGLTQPASTAELSVAAGATYTLDANSSIFNNGTLAVAGTLSASGDGIGTITTTVVDSGVISANLGTLDLIGAISGTGLFAIGTGGLLQFANTATFGNAASIGFTSGGGALVLDDPTAFAGVLENFSTGDNIGLAGFDPSTLTGGYANGADTEITFSDAHGDSVTLTFSTAQTLSNFSYNVGPEGLATVHHN
jgi:autotransporter-associated beta strand protein